MCVHSRWAVRPLTFPSPAPSPLNHSLPVDQSDHIILLHPVVCRRQCHLPAAPFAKQHAYIHGASDLPDSSLSDNQDNLI